MSVPAAVKSWPIVAAVLVAVGSGGIAALASQEATATAERLRNAGAQQFNESFASALASNMASLQGQLAAMEPPDARWSPTGAAPQDAVQLEAAAGPVDFYDAGAALFDAAGRWTGVSTAAAKAMPLSDAPAYQSVMADMRRFGLGISDLMPTLGSGPVIAFAVPSARQPALVIVRFVTRKNFGAVGTDAVMDGLVKSGSSGEFFLLDRTGQAYTASNPSRRGRQMPGLPDEQVPKTALLTEVPVEGQDNVLLTTPVEGTSMTLAFQQPRVDFYGGVDTKGRIVLAAVGMLLAFTLALAFVGEHARHRRVRAEAGRLLYVATHDPMTGLYNRSHFAEELRRALARASRSGTELAVLYIDLDRFKQLNDTLGHAAGDTVLSTVGQRLHACIRDGDAAARLGGDEFAVLLEGLRAEDITKVVAKVKATIAEPIELRNETVVIQASVGHVVSDGTGTTCDDLLEAADLSMYTDKDAGRAGAVTVEPAAPAPTVLPIPDQSRPERTLS